MKVRIRRDQIHHFKEPILDDSGQPTGEEKDVLQLDVQFYEYPELPTYGVRVDFPITRQVVKEAVRARAVEAMAQLQRDEAVRALLGAEILEFEVEV